MRAILLIGLLLTVGVMSVGFTGAKPNKACTPEANNKACVTTLDILDDTITLHDINHNAIPSISGHDVPLGVGEAFFGSNGVVFEGSVADAFEGGLTPVRLSFDRAWYLPDFNGSVVINGQPDTVQSIMITDNEIQEPDLKVTNEPADEQCLTHEANGLVHEYFDGVQEFGPVFEWQDCGDAIGKVTSENIDYSHPLPMGRDVPLAYNTAWFNNAGGITFEGNVADQVEAFLQPYGAMSSDSTYYLPSHAGTLVSVGMDNAISVGMIADALNPPVDEECLTFEETPFQFEWQPCGTGGSSNAFTTIQVPRLQGGSWPVAKSPNDTLSFTDKDFVTILFTGDEETNAIDMQVVNVDCTSCITPNKLDDFPSAPADEECLTYEDTYAKFEWQSCHQGIKEALLEALLDDPAFRTDLLNALVPPRALAP